MTWTPSFETAGAHASTCGLGYEPSDERSWPETLPHQTHDADWGQRVHLARLWEDLCWLRRESVVVFSSERQWRVLLEIPAGDTKRLAEEPQRLLREYLVGVSQKAMAYERHRSVSVVSSKISSALSSIGLTGTWRRALVLFTAALHASERRAPLPANMLEIRWKGRVWRAFSAKRVDPFGPEVGKAEAAVGRLFIEGGTYAEIARARRVSVRTVANQVGSLFRKYRVSGRAELIQHLVARRIQEAQE